MDAIAAADAATDRYRSDAGRVRLRGGEMERGNTVLVFDARNGDARKLELPLEPLELEPPGLDEYEAASPNPRIEEALAQLAQARTGAPTTALADLWTAAEALFGGVAADPHYEAVGVMGGLAEFIAVRDQLEWLGERFEAAGLTPSAELSRLDWVMASIGRPKDVLKQLRDADDRLALYRLSRVMKWDVGQGFRSEFEGVGRRFRGIAERAYLIRNFVVHQGDQARPAALAVTLPAFAELVRTCVGFVARAAESGYDPLPASVYAGMRVSRLQDGLETGILALPDDLRPLLTRVFRSAAQSTSDAPTKAG
jgi:hypothetical protein